MGKENSEQLGLDWAGEMPRLRPLGTMAFRFNGSDYDPKRDNVRLTGQLQRVFKCMADSKWRSLGDIEEVTGDPQASISAQLRHLRKPRFGSYQVDKKYLGDGLYHYKLNARQ
jgi:hypothetical protein